MKLNDPTALIWVIIFVMVSLAKGWSKLQRSVDDDSSKAEDTPPVVHPKPQRPPPPRLQRRPAAPIPRAYGVLSQQRAVPRTTLRTGTTSMSGERKVSADDMRQFVEQLSGKAQPPPPPLPPVARPPARKAEPPPPPTPEPVATAPVAAQTVAAAPAPAQTSRALQWMEALRDRNNIRNIIISAEIIGPPKAESL
ncbi:MAG: hypothetical protein ABSH14_10155 [Verrucomicrobiia bacterium]